jgi:hypothetical protein
MSGKTETCSRGSIVNVSVIRKSVHCWLYYSVNLPITEQKIFRCGKVPFNTGTLRMDHQDVVLSRLKFFLQRQVSIIYRFVLRQVK